MNGTGNVILDPVPTQAEAEADLAAPSQVEADYRRKVADVLVTADPQMAARVAAWADGWFGARA